MNKIGDLLVLNYLHDLITLKISHNYYYHQVINVNTFPYLLEYHKDCNFVSFDKFNSLILYTDIFREKE